MLAFRSTLAAVNLRVCLCPIYNTSSVLTHGAWQSFVTNDICHVVSSVQKAFLSGLLPTASAVNINAQPNLTEWSVAFLLLRLHHVLCVPSAAGLLHWHLHT